MTKCLPAMVLALLLVMLASMTLPAYSQAVYTGLGVFPGSTTMDIPTIDAEFQHSRNFAILDRHIPSINGTATVCPMKVYDGTDTLYLLAYPDKDTIFTNPIKFRYSYEFLDVTNEYNPVHYGSIVTSINSVAADSGFWPQEMSALTYDNKVNSRIVFVLAGYDTTARKHASSIASMKIDRFSLEWIRADSMTIGDIQTVGASYIQIDDLPLGTVNNIEMIYKLDKWVFVASNSDTLYYYDVGAANTFTRHAYKLSRPSDYPTLHDTTTVRIHEVKGYKRESDGKYRIGMGLVKSGMCLLTIQSNGTVEDATYQYYDYDRTIFPDTIVNPYKAFYDSTDWDGPNGHKWDYCLSHSVLPYESCGSEFVITTDEFTSFPGTPTYRPHYFEGLDFYQPNHATYYKPNPWPNPLDTNQVDTTVVWEDHRFRLNYNHRTRHGYEGIDPNRFQGSFLRLWDGAKLGENSTSANHTDMILNAYDVPEDNAVPQGYMGINNIPKVAKVPSGLHEPVLIEDRLYLAGYNTGARIFDLNCSDLQLRGYIDTEELLDTIPGSPNWIFYASLQYARGPYRIIPDPWRPGITYASDVVRGIWIHRFYDSVFTGVLSHISFQDSVYIGSVTPSDPLTFAVKDTFTISDTAKVVITDNTNLKYDSAASVVVYGELTMAGVNFDTTNVNALSDIQVRNGGTLIFGPEGTLNGLYNVTIDSGGYAATSTGMYINLKDGGTFTVAGTLEIRGTTFNGMGTLHCLDGGKIILKPGVNIHNLPQVTIDSGGTFVIGNDVNVYVAKGRSIHLKGLIDPSSFYIDSARFSAYDSWDGFIIDSTTNGWDMLGEPLLKLKHLIISKATTGITSNSATGLIDSCTLRNNTVGILINGSCPWFVYNLVTQNSTAGLVGYYIGAYNNYITKNRFINNGGDGLRLYHCGNTWFGNIVDDNGSYGLYCEELVTARFNLYWSEPVPGYTDCNTGYECRSLNDSLGNSFRGNHNGVRVADLSFPTFECHNSVHSNSYYDFIVMDTATVIGCSNYNHSFYLNNYIGGATASLVWDDALFSDPVPLKTSSGPPQQRMPKDNRLYSAIAMANAFKANGEYTNAATAYGTGVQYLSDAWEAEYLFAHWQQVFQDAAFNKPTNDPMSHGFRGKHIDYRNALQTLYAQNGRQWLKHTSGEFLGDYYMREKDYNAALPVYQYLAGLRNVNPKIARRALMAQVILKHRGLSDYDAAYDVYEQIEQYYPRTNAVIFAKIDLGLPLDSLDRVVMMSLPKSNEGTPIATALPTSVELYQAYPNPFNPSTTISYAIPEKRHVTLTVYNALGRIVGTLVDAIQEPARYSMEFDGSAHQSGTYYYRLTAKEPDSDQAETFVKQMVLMK